jgi:hypothetical protein
MYMLNHTYKRHSLELTNGRAWIRDWYPATIYNKQYNLTLDLPLKK